MTKIELARTLGAEYAAYLQDHEASTINVVRRGEVFTVALNDADAICGEIPPRDAETIGEHGEPTRKAYWAAFHAAL